MSMCMPWWPVVRSPRAGRWICPKRGFLFPVRALSKVFRGKFIAGLDDLRRQGHLPDFPQSALLGRHLKQDLYAHDWVVYAKQPLGGPQAVLDYLGRYTHRVAISNERIIGIANDQVAFRVRADAEGKKRVLRLAGSEFIARFLLHVLPSGFKRIRHYGLLSPARKKVGLASCPLGAGRAAAGTGDHRIGGGIPVPGGPP